MEQLTPNRRVYTRAELYQIRDSSAKATALVTAATGAVTTTAHWYLPNDCCCAAMVSNYAQRKQDVAAVLEERRGLEKRKHYGVLTQPLPLTPLI